MSRFVAALASLVAFAALVLQYVLLANVLAADGHGALFALWRFLGFFTILTNIAVAVVAGAMTLWPGSALAGPRLRLTVATAIAGVGLVYSLALRAQWAPTGWQKLADHALHDVTPALFLLAWWLAGHGRLRFRDCGAAVLAPALYAAYAIARGALDGWYAYWFFDPSKLAPVHMAVSVLALLFVFATIALALIAIDRWLGDLALRSKS